MSVTKLSWDKVDARQQSRRGKPCDILSAERFQSVLQHERLRADRSRLPFCLIAIDFDVEPVDVEDALETIHERVRSTDEAGWMLDGRLGVITPYTAGHGAQRLAQDIVSLIGSKLREPEIKIHEYMPEEYPAPDREETPVARTESTSVGRGDLDELLMQATPIWKRSIDVIVAIVALLLLSPLFLTVAILIKFFAPGPVFFVQWRSGLGSKPFRMLKFRTMVIDAESRRSSLMPLNEQDGPAFKLGNDPRITPLGHWLRRLSIDELPQLWNVFKGEMSLVGPRPLPCVESDGCQPWQRRRLTVAPGMTCFWQTENRSSAIPFDRWMRMDVHYVDTRSLKTDIRILARTFLFVIGLRGR
jgi:lipopolysaccharide/colanic/teichoic acid biosynthesis glycosyltransferase